MIFISIFVENLSVIRWYTWFSVWLRIGSNPADSNRVRSHTENPLFFLSLVISLCDLTTAHNQLNAQMIKVLFIKCKVSNLCSPFIFYYNTLKKNHKKVWTWSVIPHKVFSRIFKSFCHVFYPLHAAAGGSNFALAYS